MIEPPVGIEEHSTTRRIVVVTGADAYNFDYWVVDSTDRNPNSIKANSKASYEIMELGEVAYIAWRVGEARPKSGTKIKFDDAGTTRIDLTPVTRNLVIALNENFEKYEFQITTLKIDNEIVDATKLVRNDDGYVWPGFPANAKCELTWEYRKKRKGDWERGGAVEGPDDTRGGNAPTIFLTPPTVEADEDTPIVINIDPKR